MPVVLRRADESDGNLMSLVKMRVDREILTEGISQRDSHRLSSRQELHFFDCLAQSCKQHRKGITCAQSLDPFFSHSQIIRIIIIQP